MNNGNFKSSLSSELESLLEYCWLPVPGQCENFTGLLICIICRNLSNNANGHFTLATLPFFYHTSIIKLATTYILEFQRLNREMNLKGKADHAC